MLIAHHIPSYCIWTFHENNSLWWNSLSWILMKNCPRHPDGFPSAFILPLRSGNSLNTKVRLSCLFYFGKNCIQIQNTSSGKSKQHMKNGFFKCNHTLTNHFRGWRAGGQCWWKGGSRLFLTPKLFQTYEQIDVPLCFSFCIAPSLWWVGQSPTEQKSAKCLPYVTLMSSKNNCALSSLEPSLSKDYSRFEKVNGGMTKKYIDSFKIVKHNLNNYYSILILQLWVNFWPLN